MKHLRYPIRPALLSLAFVAMTPSGLSAQTFNGLGFSGPESDGRPGEYYFYKGVDAVRHKDCGLAVDMYQVAASWAYKTAQFNLAVMYLHGEGVAVDRPRAMAWMSLAAERSDAKYVDARERIYAELTPDEFARANEIWRELKQKYGDDAALGRAKTRWIETRQATTRSHVGYAGNLQVGADNPGAFPSMVKQLVTSDGTPASSPDVLVLGKNGGKNGTVPSDGFATTAFGLTGGHQIPGATAYRQFQLSNNPYDPIFEHATATVGALIPAGTNEDGPDKPVPDTAVPIKQNF